MLARSILSLLILPNCEPVPTEEMVPVLLRGVRGVSVQVSIRKIISSPLEKTQRVSPPSTVHSGARALRLVVAVRVISSASARGLVVVAAALALSLALAGARASEEVAHHRVMC